MILDVNGAELLQKTVGEFSADEARTIRAYKKLLQRYGMGASHWCRECQRNDYEGAYEFNIAVSDTAIKFECPHRIMKFDSRTL